MWDVIYSYAEPQPSDGGKKGGWKRIIDLPVSPYLRAQAAAAWFAWDKSHVSFQALAEQTVWKGQPANNQEILWVWGYSDHDIMY